MRKEIGVVVIGYGHLGRWHAQKVDAYDGVKLVAIVDSDAQSRSRAKEAHSHAIVTGDISDVIDHVDAAIVVTPTSSHFELLNYLMAKKKHIFCEKPMTETLRQAEQIIESATDYAPVIQVGHSERFHEIFDSFRSYSAFTEAPASIVMNRLGSFKGRATDVDVVADLMIHDLDLLLYLFCKVPQKVLARGHKIRTRHWDHVTASFEFSDNSIAMVTVGRNYVKEVRSLEVTNTQGTLHVDLLNNEVLLAAGSAEQSSEYVVTSKYNKRDHLMIEQTRFYEAINRGTSPVVSVRDGHNVMKLLDHVWKSLETGQTIMIS